MNQPSSPIVRSLLVGVVACSPLVGWHEVQLRREESKLSSILAAREAEVAASPEVAERLRRYRSNQALLEHQTNVTSSLEQDDLAPLELLTMALASSFDGLQIEIVRYDRGWVCISVEAERRDIVVRYSQQLGEDPNLSDLRVQDESHRRYTVRGRWKAIE